MENIKLKNVGMETPEFFPKETYESVHSRMVSKKGKKAWYQFAWSWNAVVYRFESCNEYNRAFTNSVQRYGNAPEQPEKYRQEKYLFNFFITGLSILESLLYGLYMISHFIKPNSFPVSENDFRGITPEKVKDKFKCHFEKEKLTEILIDLVEGEEFEEWKNIRNILAHRGAQGRSYHVGGKHHGQALWIKGIQIDPETTSTKYKWLKKQVKIVLEEMDNFSSNKL